MNRQEIENLIKSNSVKDFKDYNIFMEYTISINEDLFNKYFTSNSNVEKLGVIASFKSIIILYFDVESLSLFTKTIKFEDVEWINYQHDLENLKKPSYNCICCGKEIQCLTDSDGKDDWSMWNNGAVDTFEPGFGSRFDTDSFVFGICDNCIEEKREKGIIKYL